MAITLVDATQADASATSITGTEPTGAAENDLIIAWVQIAQNPSDGTWTDPTDFTQIDQFAETTGNRDQHWYLGYKVRGSDAGNGYQWTNSGSSDTCSIILAAFRGCDTSTPIDVTFVRGTHYIAYDSASNNVNTAAQDITTNTDNAWVLLCQAVSRTISGSAGPPSGYTVVEDALTGAGANDGLYMCRKEVTSAGTENPGVFTHTDDAVDGADSKVATIALRPAAGGTTIAVPTGPWR